MSQERISTEIPGGMGWAELKYGQKPNGSLERIKIPGEQTWAEINGHGSVYWGSPKEAVPYIGAAALGAGTASLIYLLTGADQTELGNMAEFRWGVAIMGAFVGMGIHGTYGEEISKSLDRVFGVPPDDSKPQK